MVRAIKQYNEIVQVTRITDAYQDDNGNYVPGSSQVFEIKCGIILNGGGKTIKGTDGLDVVFNYRLRIPLSEPKLEYGDVLRVVGTEFNGKLLGYQQGQLHALGWV